MGRSDVIKLIDNSEQKVFDKNQVKSFIKKAMNNQVAYLKKGDVITLPVGHKKRPCVIIRIIKDVVYSIPLSTTEDEFNVCEYNSRFFGSGYFSRQMNISKLEISETLFLGVFDNNKSLNMAIGLLKIELNKIL